MASYSMAIKRVIMGLCVSYSMSVYSMEHRDLENAVNEGSSQSVAQSRWFSRYLPRSMFDNNSFIELPVPRVPSRMVAMCSPERVRKALMVGASITVLVTTVYYASNAIDGIMYELKKTEASAQDAYRSFEQCREEVVTLKALCSSVVEICNKSLTQL